MTSDDYEAGWESGRDLQAQKFVESAKEWSKAKSKIEAYEKFHKAVRMVGVYSQTNIKWSIALVALEELEVELDRLDIC